MRPTIPSPEHQVEFPTGVKFPKRYLRNSLHDNIEITKKLSFLDLSSVGSKNSLNETPKSFRNETFKFPKRYPENSLHESPECPKGDQ